MGMTWRSLDLLRKNLGDVGEGVSSYIQGRQEDARREEQYKMLDSMSRKTPKAGGQGAPGVAAGTPSPATGQPSVEPAGERQYDPRLMSLAFSGANYNALKALEALQPHRQIIHGERTGIQQLETPAFGAGDTKISTLQPGSEHLTPEQQHKQRYAELQLKSKNPQTPLTPSEKYELQIGDQLFQNDLTLAGARAGAVQAATQPTRTQAEIDKEARTAAKERGTATKKAVGLGKTMNATEEKDIEYRLSLNPITDPQSGKIVGWEDRDGRHPFNPNDPSGQGYPDPKKPAYPTMTERKAAQKRLEEIQRKRESKETEMNVEQEKARQPLSEGWRDDLIPGYQARLLG